MTYEKQSAQLPLIVVTGNGPNLFGRNWLKYIRLNWQRIATVRNLSLGLKELLDRHDTLFKDELGTIQPQQATLHVQAEATPKILQAPTNAVCSQGCCWTGIRST